MTYVVILDSGANGREEFTNLTMAKRRARELAVERREVVSVIDTYSPGFQLIATPWNKRVKWTGSAPAWYFNA